MERGMKREEKKEKVALMDQFPTYALCFEYINKIILKRCQSKKCL